MRLGTILTYFRQLATLQKAGIPLLTALTNLQSNTRNAHLGRISGEIHERIKAGWTLTQSMGMYPGVFTPLQLGLVQAGETSGRLDENLGAIVEILEYRRRQRMKFITGLVYPFFLLHLVMLLPSLHLLVRQASLSRILGTAAGVVLSVYFLLFLVYFVYRLMNSRPRGRRAIACVVGVIPWVGSAVRKLALARFLRVAGALVDSGIGIEQAMEMSAHASGNALMEERALKVIPFVRRGMPLSQALAQTRGFPPTLANLAETGEQSGELGTMLKKFSILSQEEAETTINRVAILLPLLLFLLAAVAIGIFIITFWDSYYGGMDL